MSQFIAGGEPSTRWHLPPRLYRFLFARVCLSLGVRSVLASALLCLVLLVDRFLPYLGFFAFWFCWCDLALHCLLVSGFVSGASWVAFVLSCLVLSCLVRSGIVLFLSCLVSSGLVLSALVSSYFASSGLVIYFCLVICLVFSCLS